MTSCELENPTRRSCSCLPGPTAHPSVRCWSGCSGCLLLSAVYNFHTPGADADGCLCYCSTPGGFPTPSWLIWLHWALLLGCFIIFFRFLCPPYIFVRFVQYFDYVAAFLHHNTHKYLWGKLSKHDTDVKYRIHNLSLAFKAKNQYQCKCLARCLVKWSCVICGQN